MYCSNCGKKLASTDRFCNHCGTAVQKDNRFQATTTDQNPFGQKKADDLKKPEQASAGEDSADKDLSEIKVHPISETFDWNVHTFPGSEPHPTEEVDFDWHMDDEIALAPDPPKRKYSRPAYRSAAPFPDSVHEKKKDEETRHKAAEKFWSKPEGEDLLTENQDITAKPPETTETKEDKEKKKEQKAGLGAPVFIGIGPDLNSIPSKDSVKENSMKAPTPVPQTLETQKPQERQEPEEKPYSAISKEIENQKEKRIVGPEMWQPEAPSVTVEGTDKDSVITGKALEEEIFGDIESPKNPTLARQTAKIDKFYTFNKKNEEFQKLLDQEYEKFKESRGVRPDSPGNDATLMRSDPDRVPDDMPAIHAKNQVEEMSKARELFFSDDVDTGFPSFQDSATEGKDKGEDSSEELSPDPPLSTPPAEELKTEKSVEPNRSPEGKDFEHQTEDEKNAEAFWTERDQSNLKKTEEPAENKKKNGKAGITVIVVLSVILAILVALLAIRFIAPDSAVSKKMDQMTHSLFSVFQKDNGDAVIAETNPGSPMEDKTGLIQLELDKNKDGAIETIRYNGSLQYEEGTAYGVEDINRSKELTENKWYTDKDGKKHYYDRSLVGTVIEYVSNAAVSQGETIDTLDIGQFRIGEKGYYVWTGEYKGNQGQTGPMEKKIYLITVDGHTMKVANRYNI